jgi:hypothetical protein
VLLSALSFGRTNAAGRMLMRGVFRSSMLIIKNIFKTVEIFLKLLHNEELLRFCEHDVAQLKVLNSQGPYYCACLSWFE